MKKAFAIPKAFRAISTGGAEVNYVRNPPDTGHYTEVKPFAFCPVTPVSGTVFWGLPTDSLPTIMNYAL